MEYPSVKTSLNEVTGILNSQFKVYFKQENDQPSGSFKLRGIGYLIGKSIEEAKKLGKENVEVFSSSGGNAGLAAAYASQFYKVKCTVVLPKLAKKQSVINALENYGAQVLVAGEQWSEADKYLREEIIGNLKDSIYPVYCHPFDNPLIWDGHSTMIDEIEQQLTEVQISKVKGIICSVGGGGLFNGVVHGLKNSKFLQKVPVLAVETTGVPCFAQAVKEDKVVHLKSVKTLATSLAASYVSSKSLENYHSHPVYNAVIPDIDSIKGTLYYYDNFNQLVEPACGASISILNENSEFLLKLGDLNSDDIIIVIVCGGTVTTEQDIPHYRTLV